MTPQPPPDEMNPPPDAPMLPPTGTEFRVCEDIARRQRTGISKYGTTVADNPLALRQWLQHAYEESLDQAVYLKRAMEEMAVKDSPAVPAQGGDLKSSHLAEHAPSVEDALGLPKGSFAEHVRQQNEPPAADSLRETPRADEIERELSDSPVNIETACEILMDRYRTLERELAEAQAQLVPCSLSEAARRPAKSISAIHQYDADACCRMLEKLRTELTAATQDSERLEWLMNRIDEYTSHDHPCHGMTREEIDAARREEA